VRDFLGHQLLKKDYAPWSYLAACTFETVLRIHYYITAISNLFHLFQHFLYNLLEDQNF
jgi:hypothetical protein